jgi:hypothetical protein
MNGVLNNMVLRKRLLTAQLFSGPIISFDTTDLCDCQLPALERVEVAYAKLVSGKSGFTRLPTRPLSSSTVP